MILVSVTYRGKDKYRVSKYLPPYEVIVEQVHFLLCWFHFIQTYGFFASLVQCLFFFNFACRNYLAMMVCRITMISQHLSRWNSVIWSRTCLLSTRCLSVYSPLWGSSHSVKSKSMDLHLCYHYVYLNTIKWSEVYIKRLLLKRIDTCPS